MEKLQDLRYIVFGIDTKTPRLPKIENLHSGTIFKSLKEAKEYAVDGVDYHEFDKFLIGVFLLDTKDEQMFISAIESFGFKKDIKDPNQLELWQNIR